MLAYVRCCASTGRSSEETAEIVEEWRVITSRKFRRYADTEPIRPIQHSVAAIACFGADLIERPAPVQCGVNLKSSEEVQKVVDMMLSADYMQVPSLVHSGVKVLADWMVGLTTDQIRAQ